jgi:Delta24-sterol reductase
MSKNYVVQDLTLRYATAEKSIDYTTKSFGIWPLWLYQLPESLTYSPFLLFRKGD